MQKDLVLPLYLDSDRIEDKSSYKRYFIKVHKKRCKLRDEDTGPKPGFDD